MPLIADPSRPLVANGAGGADERARPDVAQPTAPVGAVAVAPPSAAPRGATSPSGSTTRLSGTASWYDNGTTAMRLPRGTRVRICGAGGCVERTINDYGPNKRIHPDRVADLMPRDFVTVCGCSLGAGLARVRVEILG